MAGTKEQTDAERVEAEEKLFTRQDKVGALSIRGFTQKEIADRLGISQQTVSRDWVTVQERWAARAGAKVHVVRAEQLAKLDALQREYWDAWERSQGKTEKVVESTNRQNGDTMTITTESVVGDVRYLQGVERCIEQYCDILGLKAPQRSEVSQTILYIDSALAEGV